MSDEGLPDGWRRVPLRDACRLINGRAFKPTDWTKSGLPIVRIQNLNDATKPFNRYSGEVEQRHLIDSGELLFAWSGTPGTSFGAHMWRGGKAVLNQHIFRVIPNDGLALKEFLQHAINDRLDHLIGIAHGGAGLAHVTKPVLEATELLLPSDLEEQRSIVAKLDALRARTRRAKDALDAVPALLDRLRQSILAAAFRGDLTADWREQHADVEPASELLKRIRIERRRRWEEAELAKLIAKGKPPKDDRWKAKYVEPEPIDSDEQGELPDGWCWVALEEVLADQSYGSSAKTNERATGVPVLRMGNLTRSGELDLRDLRYLPAEHSEFPELLLQSNDVLFNRTNSIEHVGKSACYQGTPHPCSLASYLIRLRPVLVDGYLIASMLNSPRGRAWARAEAGQQVGQANVSGGKLARFALALPPGDEQSVLHARIEGALGRIRGLASSLANLLDRGASLDSAVLGAAFRGELLDRQSGPARSDGGAG